MFDMMSISNGLFEDNIIEEETVSPQQFAIQSIQNGIQILESDLKWNQLLYKEALSIERKDPSLNRGLKASRQLRLFR